MFRSVFGAVRTRGETKYLCYFYAAYDVRLRHAGLQFSKSANKARPPRGAFVYWCIPGGSMAGSRLVCTH